LSCINRLVCLTKVGEKMTESQNAVNPGVFDLKLKLDKGQVFSKQNGYNFPVTYRQTVRPREENSDRRRLDMNTMAPEMMALKDRLKATWMSGDYGYFATFMKAGAMEFLDELNLEPGMRMLDVGCGAGQIAIPAALRGAQVTGIDLASNLLDQARTQARFAEVKINFEQGDAETLPCDDESFDLVVSLIGAMFAPRPERVASELVRVCRTGGRIVMANWTPQGFVGELFRTVAKFVPPPEIMPSPVKWGEEETVRQRLHAGLVELNCSLRRFPFFYPFPPRDVVGLYRTHYGPINRAFASLDKKGQESLRQALEQLWIDHNVAEDGTTQYPSEYLLVTAVKG